MRTRQKANFESDRRSEPRDEMWVIYARLYANNMSLAFKWLCSSFLSYT